VQRRQPAATASAAACRLAVDGDREPGPHAALGQRRDPGGETALERLGVEEAKDPPEGSCLFSVRRVFVIVGRSSRFWGWTPVTTRMN
jgi:hypothetical protein